MSALQKLFPLMFHRRLALLSAGAVVVLMVMAVQLANLTVAQGANNRHTAEERLDVRRFLPTSRGSIVDRTGEVLAVDRPSYDIAVDYSVISGRWATEQAMALARDKHGDGWNELSPTARERAVFRELAYFEFQTERLWDIIALRAGLTREELDQKLDAIRTRVEKLAETVWRKQENEFRLLYGEDANFHKQDVLEHREPHVVAQNIQQDIAFELMRFSEDLPGLVVIDATAREYPWSFATVTLDRSTLPVGLRADDAAEINLVGVADHMIGGVRTGVWASDIEARPFRAVADPKGPIDLGGYSVRFQHDAVGSWGIEAVFEHRLRGRRGMETQHLATETVDRVEAVRGETIELTIDVHLQAAIQGLLSPEFGLTVVQPFHAGYDPFADAYRPPALPLGTRLNAAAVVLDVESGEILAMVTMPTRTEGNIWPPQMQQANLPFLNRATEVSYAPGSIVKPLVLAASVTEGAHDLAERIYCNGHYFPHLKEHARCWIYREAYRMATHTDRVGGPLGPAEAIARSCNIFFYTLADQLGAPRLTEWYRRFGLGRPLNIGLLQTFDRETEEGAPYTAYIGEHPGDLPAADVASTLDVFQEVIMGIGQGPITWTPMHAANAYAILARGGTARQPTIIKRSLRDGTTPIEMDLELDPRAVRTALEGLRGSVSESYGTGSTIYHPGGQSEPLINAEGVTVWAKTGTAQALPKTLPRDEDEDGSLDTLDGLDHAWFVGLVGTGEPNRARPEYAIAVIVEHGGSGGRVAGPIANQIIHLLQNHGYLGSDDSIAATPNR